MPQPIGREPGVYLGLPMQEYQDDSAIGRSGVRRLLISWEEYWTNSPLNPNREKEELTAALLLGTMYHQMVLEPEKPFLWEIKDHPPESKAAKGGKILQSTTEEGKIGRGDYNDLVRMYTRLLKVPKHWNALHGGFSEVSIFWRDEDSGLMLKCRPDSFSPEWVGDLKTCVSTSNRALRYDFGRYGYEISGTIYSEGMQALKKMIRNGYKMPPEFDYEFVTRFIERETQIFAFVFQEKEPPYTTRCWEQTPYISEIGHKKLVTGIAVYHDNIDVFPDGAPAYMDVEKITEDMVSKSIEY